MEELETERKMSCSEELNKASPNSSWIFVDDCGGNGEENAEKNVYYLNCESEESYDKLEEAESDSDSVSIISESDEDLEPTPFDTIPAAEELFTSEEYMEEEYLCSKFWTCGCIFLAIFTPILINIIVTEKPKTTFHDNPKVEVEKFLGLDAYDTDTHFDYDVRPSKEILELIPDSSDDLYTPTFFDPKEMKQIQPIQEECTKKVDFPNNDHTKIIRYNQRVKSEKFKKKKLKDPRNEQKPYLPKKQKKGDKFKKQDHKKTHKTPKYEKTKGEFPLKYKEKNTRKPEKTCSGEITKLKSLLDNQEAKIRQLSRLLSDKDRDIKLLERRILQEIKDLKRIQKTYKESKQNATLSGEWYNNYFDGRGKLRNREQAASWLFERAEFRNRKRTRRETWYVDWMSQREAERTKRDDWRFSY